ncbi:MAG: hypothetical protein IH899_07515 [Planctomycetes bacterium]|nr:hypothetical protein [Planctomycetota bacterium]
MLILWTALYLKGIFDGVNDRVNHGSDILEKPPRTFRQPHYFIADMLLKEE